MDLVISTRMACVPCDVLVTGESVCWVCGQPMTPAVSYLNPTSIQYRNAMLAHINQETP